VIISGWTRVFGVSDRHQPRAAAIINRAPAPLPRTPLALRELRIVARIPVAGGWGWGFGLGFLGVGVFVWWGVFPPPPPPPPPPSCGAGCGGGLG